MLNSPHILIVDDDDRIRELLQQFLVGKNYFVTVAANAEQAEYLLGMLEYDLMILDIMMPGEDGLSFLGRIRKGNNIPILMLSARSEAEDRILGFEKGSDDYLAKPFEPKELLLRIQAILKRVQQQRVIEKRIYFGSFCWNPDTQQLEDNNEPVYLTSTESGLLAFFIQNTGKELSREELADATGISMNERSIDVQITRIRRKLEQNPKRPVFLQTVRGAGYVFHIR